MLMRVRILVLLFLGAVVGVVVVAQDNLDHHRLVFHPSQPDPGPRPIRFSDNHYFYNFTADDEERGKVRQKENKPHPVYNKKRDNSFLIKEVTQRSSIGGEDGELRTESSFIQGNVLGGGVENLGRTGFVGYG
jgi:hypothetical protein